MRLFDLNSTISRALCVCVCACWLFALIVNLADCILKCAKISSQTAHTNDLQKQNILIVNFWEAQKLMENKL